MKGMSWLEYLASFLGNREQKLSCTTVDLNNPQNTFAPTKEKRRAKPYLSSFQISDYIEFILNKPEIKSKEILHLDPGFMREGKITDPFEAKITSLKQGDMRFTKKIREANHILWPICQSQHWFLMIISKKDKRIQLQCLDGFNSETAHQGLFKEVRGCLRKIFGAGYSYRQQSLMVQVQNNAYNCGAVVGFYAKLFCENPLEFLKKTKELGADLYSYHKERNEMLKTIQPKNTKPSHRHVRQKVITL